MVLTLFPFRYHYTALHGIHAYSIKVQNLQALGQHLGMNWLVQVHEIIFSRPLKHYCKTMV